METIGRRKFDQWFPQAALGLALLGLAACSSGDETTGAVAPGGSAGANGSIVFINNAGNSTMTTVALKGDTGSKVLNTIPAAEFGNVALGDMQVSQEDWIFVNLAAANQVATIDPLTAATPEHRTNLTTGTRPVHMYRDRNDGELIWSMNDGDNAGGAATAGDDLINCAAQGGGSVTVLHNSHLGPGGTTPIKLGTTCLLADGHKVAAFADNGRVFVSSETAGEIAVLNGAPPVTGAPALIDRIDLCKASKEGAPCNDESNTPLTTAFTPNKSAPHGIRWSKLTKKIYSIQEGYDEIAEIDPTTLAITKTFDLAGTDYTSYGISPDGKYLLLRGQTTAPQATKLGVIDLSAAVPTIVNLTTPDLVGTSPGAFKFSPDSRRFYILAGNAATASKEDKLFVYDWTTVASGLTLLKEIDLDTTTDGVHNFDVLAEGAGVPTYLVVSNASAHSISIINTTDHEIKQRIAGLFRPTGVLVFTSGVAQSGNQASN